MITPVILCGGSGTRLWPVSRKSFPKQFVPLIDDKSLLQLTLERVSRLSDTVLALASETHRFMVAENMRAAGTKGTIVLEPAARNTAAAMIIAALHQLESGTPEDLLLFCPADHHIADSEAFEKTILQGAAAAQDGAIVTFGVNPTFPSTAYGYIEQGDDRKNGSFSVKRFIEKPDAENAEKLLLQGGVLWNAGIFLMRVDTLLNAAQQHAKDILQSCKDSLVNKHQENLADDQAFLRLDADHFTACRSESIDYAVMEHHKDLAVVPFNGSWSDVGSWNSVATLTPADDNQNRIHGTGVVHKGKNNFIYAPHRPVVALGTEDLLIIDTADAVLVAQKDNVEQVKEVVEILQKKQISQATTHRKVSRPWGWYDSLDLGERFQVKRIGVKPGASLSLQKHHHRAEHWIVVKGTAEVTCGEKTFLLCENQSTYIPIGEIHRLRNSGKIELEMIEVQSGSYLGEDDIVRLDDTYGRIKPTK